MMRAMEKVPSWKDFIRAVRRMKPKPTLDEFLTEACSEDIRSTATLTRERGPIQRRPPPGATTMTRTLIT
eukprot:1188426-Rhodomonas_salina.1